MSFSLAFESGLNVYHKLEEKSDAIFREQPAASMSRKLFGNVVREMTAKLTHLIYYIQKPWSKQELNAMVPTRITWS